MEELQKFEELKQTLLKKMQYENSQIPQSIIATLERIYNLLQNFYAEKTSSNKAITEYAMGNFNELKARLGRVNEKRSDEQLGELNAVLSKVERDLEAIEVERKRGKDTEELKTQKKETLNKNRDNISSLNMNSKMIINRIMALLEDSLADVRSMARRHLSYNGFSDGRIFEIDAEAKSLINMLLNRNQEKLNEQFTLADRSVLEHLLQEYDAYMIEAAKPEKTLHQKFVEGYKVKEEDLVKQPKTQDETSKKTIERLPDMIL